MKLTPKQWQLVVDNLHLPRWFIKRWYSNIKGLLLEKLETVANDGLYHAASKFDEEKRIKFAYYASIIIRQKIRRELSNYYKAPVTIDIANTLRGFENFVDNKSDFMEEVDAADEQTVIIEKYNTYKQTLSGRSRFILDKVYSENKSMSEVANSLNISREWVRQKVHSLIENFKKRIAT